MKFTEIRDEHNHFKTQHFGASGSSECGSGVWFTLPCNNPAIPSLYLAENTGSCGDTSGAQRA